MEIMEESKQATPAKTHIFDSVGRSVGRLVRHVMKTEDHRATQRHTSQTSSA